MMATVSHMPNQTAIVPSVTATLDNYRKGLEPDTLDRAYQLAERIAVTRMCGVTSPDDALVRIMTGRELGLTCMQSIRGVYVVEGRPGLDASLMMALAQQSSDCERFECVEDTVEAVTYAVKRAGQTEQTVRWTIADAHRAKLVDRGKDPAQNNWNKYPRQMLHARCKSEAARRVFPDRIFGLLSREEMMDGDVGAAGPPAMITVNAEPSIPPTHAFDSLRDTLIAKVNAASSKEEQKAVREEIAKHKESGALPQAWLEPVASAYNARFAKKKTEPAQVTTTVQEPVAPPAESQPAREPGED